MSAAGKKQAEKKDKKQVAIGNQTIHNKRRELLLF